MKGYDSRCAMCRLMRSLAFAGIGMGLGSGVAYMLGTSKDNMLLTGIVVAAILVFGKMNKK